MATLIKIPFKRLKYLYIVKGYSSLQLSKIYQCCSDTILNHLKKYKIKTRHARNYGLKTKYSKKFIYNLYHTKKVSIRSLSKKLKCNNAALFKLIKFYNIPVKSRSVVMKGRPISEKCRQSVIQRNIKYHYDKKVFKKLYKKNVPLKVIAKRLSLPFSCIQGIAGTLMIKRFKPKIDEKDICYLYKNKVINKDRIGSKYKISGPRVNDILKKHKIKIRTLSKSRKGLKLSYKARCSLALKRRKYKKVFKKVNYKRKYSFTYSSWERRVFKRDKYKCVICGAYKNIVAHHLYSYMKYYKLRFNTKNGITLCAKHHQNKFKKSFHYIYKTFNFTFEDFIAYLIQSGKKDLANKIDKEVKPYLLKILNK